MLETLYSGEHIPGATAGECVGYCDGSANGVEVAGILVGEFLDG